METGYYVQEVHRLDPLINQHKSKVSKKYLVSNLFRRVLIHYFASFSYKFDNFALFL